MNLEHQKFIQLIDEIKSSLNGTDGSRRVFKNYDELEKIFEPYLKSSQLNENELNQFIQKYIEYSVDTDQLEYTNQLWSKSDSYSLVGEYLSKATNTSMYTFEVAPVATLLERKMIERLSSLIWGKATEGIMTSGGSSSNFQALMTARNLMIEQSKDAGLSSLDKRPVFFAAKNAHYSIKRSANMLGIGHDGLIEIETNSNGQMDLQDLQRQIQNQKEQGNLPFCVVSTGGTTVEGAFDDLTEIARIKNAHGLWLHIDGAYGGSVLLGKESKKLLKGVEQADSMSWDFHKILGINLPCAFLFTRQTGVLQKSLESNNDGYLFHQQATEEAFDNKRFDLGPLSLQCGRQNDILKLWLTWWMRGEDFFGNKIDRLITCAKEFQKSIEQSDDFIMEYPTDYLNVCFRFKEQGKNLSIAKIRNELLKERELLINYSHNENGDFFRMVFTRTEWENGRSLEILEKIRKYSTL